MALGATPLTSPTSTYDPTCLPTRSIYPLEIGPVFGDFMEVTCISRGGRRTRRICWVVGRLCRVIRMGEDYARGVSWD